MPRKGRPSRASAHVDHAARGDGESLRCSSPSPCEGYPLREFVTQVVVDWRCVATLDVCAEQLAGAPEQLRQLVGIQHQEGQRRVVPRDLESDGR